MAPGVFCSVLLWCHPSWVHCITQSSSVGWVCYSAVLSSLVTSVGLLCHGNLETLQWTSTTFAMTCGNYIQIINLTLRSVVPFIVRCAVGCVDGCRCEGTQAAWLRRTWLKGVTISCYYCLNCIERVTSCKSRTIIWASSSDYDKKL